MSLTLWNTYRCSDGTWLAMGMLQSDPHWNVLLHALGNPPSLRDDMRFSDHLSRCENAQACVAILDDIFASLPRDQWMLRLIHEGNLPVSLVNTTAQAAVDPQVLANGYITALDHPTFGMLAVAGFPIAPSETPAQIRRCGPELGEHTEEVLMELLNLTWEQLSELKSREVI